MLQSIPRGAYFAAPNGPGRDVGEAARPILLLPWRSGVVEAAFSAPHLHNALIARGGEGGMMTWPAMKLQRVSRDYQVDENLARHLLDLARGDEGIIQRAYDEWNKGDQRRSLEWHVGSRAHLEDLQRRHPRG